MRRVEAILSAMRGLEERSGGLKTPQSERSGVLKTPQSERSGGLKTPQTVAWKSRKIQSGTWALFVYCPPGFKPRQGQRPTSLQGPFLYA